MPDELPIAFTYTSAREAGFSDRKIAMLVADGTLERLGRGAYRKREAPLADHDLVEIALRAPDATLCLLSALVHHELSDAIPQTIHCALPRTRRPPKVASPVTWHRFQPATFALGRTMLLVDDKLHIGLYSAERSLIDAFRLRHTLGHAVAITALKRWLNTRTTTPGMLLQMARPFPKAMPALRQALETLL